MVIMPILQMQKPSLREGWRLPWAQGCEWTREMVTSLGAPSCTLRNPKCSGQGLAQREHPWVHSAPCPALPPDAELQW